MPGLFVVHVVSTASLESEVSLQHLFFPLQTSHPETPWFWHIQCSQGLHWSLALEVIQERISNRKKRKKKPPTPNRLAREYTLNKAGILPHRLERKYLTGKPRV